MEKVDIIQQVKEAHLVSYAQVVNTMMQQSQVFSAAGLANLKKAENHKDCQEILDSNIEGIKKIVEANKFLLDSSIESIKEVEKLMEGSKNG